LWIIAFCPVSYKHFLGLFKNVVVLSLESTLDLITTSTVVRSLLIISVPHIAVAFIITIANVIIIL
jgi:hypothetical protein